MYEGTNVLNNENENNILSVEYIRLVMSDLAGLGVEIICFKDGLGYMFDDYRRNFWTKKRDEKENKGSNLGR